MYLWIFIAVAVVLCGIFLVMSKDISNKNEIAVPITNISSVKVEQKENNSTQEEIDLTQVNVDFEEDAEDLSDGIVDDSQFDDEGDLNSIENEVY